MKTGKILSRLRFVVMTALFTAAAGLFCAPVVHAQTLNEWLQQPMMTGDWGGVRTTLANDGVTFKGQYMSQFGGNVSGGRGQGFDYTQQVFAGANWNLQKLLGWQGATLHTFVIDRAGRNITSDYVSGPGANSFEQFGIYGAGQNFRLWKLQLEQQLFNDRLNLLVGYYSIGNEFNFNPMLCNLLSNAFCAHDQSLPQNTGFLVDPASSWGGRAKVFILPNLYIMSGAFEVNPNLASKTDRGFELNLDGATGAAIPLEIGYTSAVGPTGMLGHYKLGAVYDTSYAADKEFPSIERKGRYQAWFTADQMVYRVAPGSFRGLTVFGSATYADKRTSMQYLYVTGGFIFYGPFASRAGDSINFGWVRSFVNPRVLKADAAKLAAMGDDSTDLEPFESELELTYTFQATGWLTVTPDIQYVINSGAENAEKFHDALVLATQLEANF